MATPLWIGFGFLAFLLLVLVWVLLSDSAKLTEIQYQIIRFLMAISAGFAGGFISGGALFELSTDWGKAGRLTVSGAAGCALFFTIWFTYRKIIPDSFSFSVAAGWTFEHIVRTIAQADKAQVELIGFTDKQKRVKFSPTELHEPNARIALEKLGRGNDKLPKYRVDFSDQFYSIKTLDNHV